MAKYIPGPWVAETTIGKDERGLSVIAVIPEVERDGGTTPTRGRVAWISSRLGACQTDGHAIATARLIAAAPDLLAALKDLVAEWGDGLDDPFWNVARSVIAHAEGRP